MGRATHDVDNMQNMNTIEIKKDRGRSFLIWGGRWIGYIEAVRLRHWCGHSIPRAALLGFIKAEETRVEYALCNQGYINNASQRYYQQVTNTKADRLTAGVSYA